MDISSIKTIVNKYLDDQDISGAIGFLEKVNPESPAVNIKSSVVADGEPVFTEHSFLKKYTTWYTVTDDFLNYEGDDMDEIHPLTVVTYYIKKSSYAYFDNQTTFRKSLAKDVPWDAVETFMIDVGASLALKKQDISKLYSPCYVHKRLYLCTNDPNVWYGPFFPHEASRFIMMCGEEVPAFVEAPTWQK